eukprot:1193515-Prorocentrum_minimum.AAC.1
MDFLDKKFCEKNSRISADRSGAEERGNSQTAGAPRASPAAWRLHGAHPAGGCTSRTFPGIKGDAKGSRVDAKGGRVDAKGSRVDATHIIYSRTVAPAPRAKLRSATPFVFRPSDRRVRPCVCGGGVPLVAAGVDGSSRPVRARAVRANSSVGVGSEAVQRRGESDGWGWLRGGAVNPTVGSEAAWRIRRLGLAPRRCGESDGWLRGGAVNPMVGVGSEAVR